MAAGLVFLLGYVTVVPLVQRLRGAKVALSDGVHGHSGLGDLIHGTSVERLRHRISVPVLVVPCDA